MKQTILLAIILILILSGWANAQVSPVPVAETDMLENGARRRSVELARVKREAEKMRPEESTKEQEIRFAKVKKDFEDIQKLQDSIIKAYTTGKKINYSKISRSAIDIRKNAFRLDENLFGAKPDKPSENKNPKAFEQKGVRDLIIELDNAIGNFVKSPIFQNTKIVDSDASEKAQLELKRIMKLSNMLSSKAEKMK